MRCLALILLAAALLIAVSNSNGAVDWRAYAKQQAAHVGWVGAEWSALDAIVAPESGWNPCRRYPSTTDCGYTGSNSCGIPQANPCPSGWRGRLGTTAREQIRWLFVYIRERYGDPIHARAARDSRRPPWY